ncbi:MAG: S1/P1 nuclease [Gammaproteobacteria bacterium]|nr:S1/P1 nuclease [Gammaproteobacteria bacterium]
MRKFIATVLLLSFSTQSLAWKGDGHAIVGTLAERQLNAEARAEVARLLAGEPDPTLAGIASWADEVRANEVSGASARLHYVNFRGGDCNYVPVRDCPDGKCLIAAINGNFRILSDRTRSDAERRDALKYLVHFVGDAHQPLHATLRNDKGGGDFQVSYKGKGSNLHMVWDQLIIERRKLAPVAYANAFSAGPTTTGPGSARPSNLPAVEWALESCRIVRDGNLYPSRHVIDDAYLDRHAPIAEQRLRLAGNRLADMINRALAR